MKFSTKLENWYQENKRELPWRQTTDPYKIWLSEIMLQQTRVDQAKDYYERFLAQFPDVKSLAEAEEQEVLRLWQGLGYYSRARNIHTSAKSIYQELDNVFPQTYQDIIKLKGVGEYTAAAISSFAFKEPKPVLDGNVYRFISRYLGIYEPVNSIVGKKDIMVFLDKNIPRKTPDIFNQAIMEFGALQCTPKLTDCEICPLNIDCYAYEYDKVRDLPVKAKKINQRNRYFNYFIYLFKGNTYIKKREKKDIWENLYEFPMIETTRRYSEEYLRNENQLFFKNIQQIKKAEEVKHILSHQIIYGKFYFFEIKEEPIFLKNTQEVNWEELNKFPFPQMIVRMIEKL